MKFYVFTFTLAALLLQTPIFAGGSDPLPEQKAAFYKAREQLKEMLTGDVPLSYEKAIFTIENAWYGKVISYSDFLSALDFHEQNIRTLIDNGRDYASQDFTSSLSETEEQKKAQYEQALKNWAIYTYMTDTTVFVLENSLAVQLPYSYPAEDPFGTINWTNTQVFNLLDNGKGNCFAQASLFKIFSERLNSQASINTAPGHIYIRHADHKGAMYNVELATRSFPGTGSIETLTYTTDEALNNNISLRTLDLKQSVGLSLVYLAKGYSYRFGVKDDAFMMECAELALQHDPLNLNAMLLKAEILEERLIGKDQNITELKVDETFTEYENLISHLFELGYREMPVEMKNLIISGLQNDTAFHTLTNHTPQPFKNLKHNNTRYATLSGGLFAEMQEKKRLKKFSRTVFDTEKKEITGFTAQEETYNNYVFDDVVFAWGVDPLAQKYPQMSPYAAMGNNPIYYIDTDGREIFIYYQDAKGNNKSFKYDAGIEVPNNAFVEKTVAALDHLKSFELGEKVINKISSSTTKTLTITETFNGAEDFDFAPVTTDKKGNVITQRGAKVIPTDVEINSGNIEFNPHAGLKFGNGEAISPSTALFHEVGHAFSAFFYTTSFLVGNGTPHNQFNNLEEYSATVNFENNAARYFNEGIRTDRSGSTLYTISPTSNREAIIGEDQLSLGQGKIFNPNDADGK